MSKSSLVWLVTGCSRGIGKAIAETVLKNGHQLVATARKTDSLNYLQGLNDANLLTLPLDVNAPKAIAQTVEQAQAHFGRIDVLVNNAGYGLEGMAEEVTMEQVRHQMETNFFGLVDLTQRILPGMRERQQGWVFNIASVAGLMGFRGMSIYNASKFAVVGFSEALQQEMKPFNVQVVSIEPGPYRTDWAGSSLIRSEALQTMNPDSPYLEQNQKVDKIMQEGDGNQPGDPYQIAEVLFSATHGEACPVHMLFGDEAILYWEKKQEKLQDPDYFRTYPHSKRTV